MAFLGKYRYMWVLLTRPEKCPLCNVAALFNFKDKGYYNVRDAGCRLFRDVHVEDSRSYRDRVRQHLQADFLLGGKIS